MTTNNKDTSVATIADDKHNLDDATIYEFWATLSILLLAAGTPGSVEQIKEALGGGVVVGTVTDLKNMWETRGAH